MGLATFISSRDCDRRTKDRTRCTQSTAVPDAPMRYDAQHSCNRMAPPFAMSMNLSPENFLERRQRRMRRDDFSRRLMREHRLSSDDLIYPVFVLDGSRREEPVLSLPGISRKSIDLLLADAERCVALGVPAIALFPVIPAAKTSRSMPRPPGMPQGLVPQTVRALKARFPGAGRDHRRRARSLHQPRPGRSARRHRLCRQRRDGRRADPTGAVPCRGRCRRGRAVRHDGRAHRRAARGA